MKQRMAMLAVASVACGVLPLAASLVEVKDSYAVTVTNTVDGVTAVSEQQAAGYPEGLPTPIFWFDCTHTNGWQIERGADGTNYVSMIPSLVGDGRFLTTNTTLEGTSFTGWGSVKPKPPMLVEYDDVPGGPVLDFGKFGSRRGMMFNPHTYEAIGTSKNILSGIGAMVALWGSQEGGGYLFGGGNITGSASVEDYRWTRGWDIWMGATDATVRYRSTVFGGYRSTMSKEPGFYMHDCIPASGENIGMNGGWEAIGFSADAAQWHATGIGLGDTRSGFARDGGLRVGEMIVFGDLLTQDQMRQLQLYLRGKWLGKGLRGWNGDSHLGKLRISPEKSSRAIIDVPADETLTLQTLAGGRGGEPYTATAAVKTGEGELRLNDAAEYAAPVELASGSLALSRKAAPADVDALPAGLYMRFDASVASSMTVSNENGTNFVVRMENLAEGRHYNKPIYLRTYGAYNGDRDLRPWLSDSPLGAELPLIDLGPRTEGAKGRYLCFYYDNNGTETLFGPNTCGTLVALVCAERGGGHICNGPFKRNDRWVTAHSSQLLVNSTFGEAKVANTNSGSRIFLNGLRLGVSDGFPHAGCHVIAYAVQPAAFNAIGAEQYYTATEGSASGGVMFGEMLFWKRPLTDEELMDAQAYLSRKWLGKDIPGYSGTVSGIADLQTVKSIGPTSIDVSGACTVKVAKVSGGAPLTKTGKGTLLVGPESDTSKLFVGDGKVVLAAAEPEVSEACELAKGAAFHLDASVLDSFVFSERGGTNFVQSWYSPNGVPARQPTATVQPWLNTDASALLNGMPVVDFGPYKGQGVSSQKWMPIAQPMDSVRSAFIVRGSQEGGGMLLGESSGNVSDWTRYGSMAGDLSVPIIGSPSTMVQSGEFYLDGVLTNCASARPTGGYELIDVHPAGGTHVSALACYKGTYMRGGMRIAELVIYQRKLSEREKVATRNYLTRKWFPERPLQELPEEESVPQTLPVGGISVSGTLPMDVDQPVAAKKLEGSGTLEKTGAETLEIGDMSDFDGTVALQEGTLVLSGRPLTVAPEVVESGRIMHLDATHGLTTATNEDGTVSVTGWESRLADGWAAVPGASYGSVTIRYPTLLPYDLNGKPIVKMEYLNGGRGQEYFLFQKDGVQTMLDGIRSAFWVIGSQEGGGFLLGGGVNPVGSSRYVWHRGGSAGNGASAADPILSNHAQDEVEAASWRLNGNDVTKSTGLSGGYDLLSMVMGENAAYPASADGLAFDGRILIPQDFRERTGRQRIGELILYNRSLTGEEREKVEAYLAAKWGFSQKSATNGAAVALTAGTTLQTVGRQYVDGLSGTGAVDGDVMVRRFAKDCAESGCLSVSGTLSIAENPVFSIANIAAAGDPVVIAEAASFSGAGNLAAAVIEGAEGRLLQAVVRDGKLMLRSIRSMKIVIR